MKTNRQRIVILVLLLTPALFIVKATDSIAVKKFLLEFRVGYNVGAYTPLPIPQEIRKVESYIPTFNPSIELALWYPLNNRWGCSAGLTYKNRGMETAAQVKNYHLIMQQDEAQMEGYFTGITQTKVYTSSLFLPINITYCLSPKWRLHAGIYASYLLYGEFSGSVSDGYLRHNTPVGIKTEITAANPASYNLSENIVKWDVGAQVGCNWSIFSKINLFAEFGIGFFSIFEADFEAVSFPMYPLFGTIGVAVNY